MCSTLDLSHNALTGPVPSLPSTVASDLAYNCLSDCSITRQASCAVCIPGGLTSADEVAALTALYSSTGGAQWIRSDGWAAATLDPVRVRVATHTTHTKTHTDTSRPTPTPRYQHPHPHPHTKVTVTPTAVHVTAYRTTHTYSHWLSLETMQYVVLGKRIESR